MYFDYYIVKFSFSFYSDQSHDVINNHIEPKQGNAGANLPDVAPDGYEEIHEPAGMPIGTFRNNY